MAFVNEETNKIECDGSIIKSIQYLTEIEQTNDISNTSQRTKRYAIILFYNNELDSNSSQDNEIAKYKNLVKELYMMTQSFCYAGSGKFPFGIEDIIKASETSLEEIEKEFEVSKWPFKSRKKINFENI